MTFHQFLLILRARYRMVIAILLLTVTVTLIVSLLLPKQYTASSALVVDAKDPVAGMVMPGLAIAGYMATQADIINSDRVAQLVVTKLRMDESPVVREQWMEATEGRGDIKVWLADLLKKELYIRPSRDSNVITIEYSGTDPDFVAAVANAFAQAYIDVNLDLKVEPARQYSIWFNEQTKSLRNRLENTQQALSAYQQKTGIVATDERLDYEVTKLNELSTQLTMVEAQTSDSSSKHKSGGNPEMLTEVVQNPLINSLKSDIARLEAKIHESNVNLGRNHPQSKRAQSELASLRNRLASETRNVHNSIGTSFEVGKHKEKDLRDAIERQKMRVLDLNRQRDQLSVLKRDVEAAQRDFEGVSQRSALTRLESQAIQTNIATLHTAPVPLKPSRPKILLNVLISIFLGTLIGVGAALMLELVNRRVRSEEDLVEAFGLPVLATIPSTTLPSSVRRLPYRPSRRKKSTQALGLDSP